jgi:hypothetical protein
MRFHIVDPHCSVAGGEDLGAVGSRVEAEEIVAARILGGDPGGCRCGRGYVIQTCEERQRVGIGWMERQARDMSMMASGLLNLRGHTARDGIKRDLTAEETAAHKCHDYDPRRFSEAMGEA